MTSLLLAVFLLSALLSIVKPLFAQQAVKQPVAASVPPAKVAEKSAGTSQGIPDLSKDFILDFRRTVVPEIPIGMSLALGWTTCQIHRVDDMSPIKIILPGEITCTTGVVWRLVNTSDRPPALYFVEDIFGQRQGPDSDIAITCEISLDGGPFQPMIIPPQNALGTVFPPGTHTFQVRITGQLDSYQQAGYYRLQLAQNLTPQL